MATQPIAQSQIITKKHALERASLLLFSILDSSSSIKSSSSLATFSSSFIWPELKDKRNLIMRLFLRNIS